MLRRVLKILRNSVAENIVIIILMVEIMSAEANTAMIAAAIPAAAIITMVMVSAAVVLIAGAIDRGIVVAIVRRENVFLNDLKKPRVVLTESNRNRKTPVRGIVRRMIAASQAAIVRVQRKR